MSNRQYQTALLHLAAPLAALWLLTVASGCRERPTSKGGEADAKASANADGKSAAIAPAAGQTVDLVIDYGDGVEKRFTAIPWREGMTVLDVLEAAKAHRHGITFSVRGSGEQALLTKLDDVANQEGAAGAKNWIYYVNDHKADKSLGARTVKSGDAILWKFESYE